MTSTGQPRNIVDERWERLKDLFSRAVELPEKERPYFQDHLARILLPLQETDGSWWDYPLYDYHQPAGTAMAVASLVRCLHESQ